MLNYFILRLISMRCSSANHNLELSVSSNEEDEPLKFIVYKCVPDQCFKNLNSLEMSSKNHTASDSIQQISKDHTTYNMLQHWEETTTERNSDLECLSSAKNQNPTEYKLLPKTFRLYPYPTYHSTDNDNPMISHLATKNPTEPTFPVIIEETEKSNAFYNNKGLIYSNEAGKATNEALYQDEPLESTITDTNSIELTSDPNYYYNLWLKNKTFTLPKPVLKRKNDLFQEFEPPEKQRMLNAGRWEPSLKEVSDLKTLFKLRYNDNISSLEYIIIPPKPFSCQLLNKYTFFIVRIEILLEIFLSSTLEKEKNIHKVLFTEDFSILNRFSFDLFGNINMQQPDILKKASSTADMLVKFFEILDFKDFEDLIFELKKCLELKNESNVEMEILTNLLSDIFSYLMSEESRDFKSVIVEFYSFIHKFNELQIFYDRNIIKAFAIFLILLKRNYLVLPKLNKKPIGDFDTSNINEFFQNEVIFSSSLFFVFIKYLPCSNPGNNISNMCTSILFNCISKQIIVESSLGLLHIDVIKILRYIFFDLMQFKLFGDYNKIFEFEQTPEILTSRFPNLNTYLEEILLHIQNEFKNIVERINDEKNSPNLSETLSFESFPLSDDFDDINIYRLRLILEYVYTLKIYTDCRRKHFFFYEYILSNFHASKKKY